MLQWKDSPYSYKCKVYFILDHEYEETLHLFNKNAAVGDLQYLSFGSPNTFIPENIMLPSSKEHFRAICDIIEDCYNKGECASNACGLVAEYIRSIYK